MSPNEPNQTDEVRKIIEKSTSKVSLRDLEKKGFKNVKVLKSNDIDKMIRRAVDQALSEGVKDQDAIVARTKNELNEQMAATKRGAQELQQLRDENTALVARMRDLESKGGGSSARVKELEDTLARSERLCREQEEGSRGMRAEHDELRSRVHQAETEKRLVEELEVPRLRRRIAELEAETFAHRTAAPASQVGVDPELMRAMFTEMVKEVSAGSSKAVASELQKLQQSMAQSGRAAGGVSDADLGAMKVSLQSLFKHEGQVAVESNIANVQLKESTVEGVKSSLSRLKALRKTKDG